MPGGHCLDLDLDLEVLGAGISTGEEEEVRREEDAMAF